MLKLWVNNNVRDDHKVAILAFWALFIQFVEKGNFPRDDYILLEAPQYKQVVFDLLNNGKKAVNLISFRILHSIPYLPKNWRLSKFRLRPIQFCLMKKTFTAPPPT